MRACSGSTAARGTAISGDSPLFFSSLGIFRLCRRRQGRRVWNCHQAAFLELPGARLLMRITLLGEDFSSRARKISASSRYRCCSRWETGKDRSGECLLAGAGATFVVAGLRDFRERDGIGSAHQKRANSSIAGCRQRIRYPRSGKPSVRNRDDFFVSVAGVDRKLFQKTPCAEKPVCQ